MNIESMKRHIAKPVEVKLSDGDIVKLSPLTVEDIPDIIQLQQNMFGNTKEGEEAKLVINKDTSELIMRLIRKSMLMADASLESPDLDGFIASNFMLLMPHILDINSLVTGREKLKAEKISKIKQRIDESSSTVAQSGKETTG